MPTYNHTRGDGPYNPCPTCALELSAGELRLATQSLQDRISRQDMVLYEHLELSVRLRVKVKELVAEVCQIIEAHRDRLRWDGMDALLLNEMDVLRDDIQAWADHEFRIPDESKDIGTLTERVLTLERELAILRSSRSV